MNFTCRVMIRSVPVTKGGWHISKRITPILNMSAFSLYEFPAAGDDGWNFGEPVVTQQPPCSGARYIAVPTPWVRLSSLIILALLLD